MNIDNFIKENKDFLSEFHSKISNQDTNGILLIEELDNPLFSHTLMMHSLIFNMGLKLKPVIIKSSLFDIKYFQSYFPESSFIQLPKISSFNIKIIKIIILIKLFIPFLTNHILSVKYDGIKYGDILYDSFLREKSLGSLDLRNFRNLRYTFNIFLRIIIRHKQIKKIINIINPKAVLVTQTIGIRCGILLRCALKKKIPSFLNSYALTRNNLLKYDSIRETKTQVVLYTSLHDMEYTLSMPNLDDNFNTIYNSLTSGNLSLDAKYAYINTSEVFTDRNNFCKYYSIDPSKKNIFVMLHAFTDYPHSSTFKMLFKDYRDWFLQTLSFAKQYNKVNWFFKRHPSDKFYPTNDVNYEEIFSDLPPHIKFINTTDNFNNRNLPIAADAVITGCGSAGFEMPASYGIPSILAGGSNYSHFSFTQFPKTKRKYFKTLSMLKDIQPLSSSDQNIAKAFYINYHYFSTFYSSFIPNLSFDDQLSPEIANTYFDKVLLLYENNAERIKNEIASFSFELSRPDFKAFRTKNYHPWDEFISIPENFNNVYNSKYSQKILSECFSILQGLEISYFLANGTLLSIVKNKKIFDKNHNFDIFVMLPVNTINILGKFLRNGFKIGRYVSVYGDLQHLSIYKEDVILNLIFLKTINENVINFNTKENYFILPKYHFESIEILNIDEINIQIPSEANILLNCIYGINWYKGDITNFNNDYFQQYDGDIAKVLLSFDKK